jgi:hypothetical protein
LEKQKVKEVKAEAKVEIDKSIEELRKELEILKKRKAEQLKQQKEKVKEEPVGAIDLDNIEERLDEIEDFLDENIKSTESEEINLTDIAAELESIKTQIIPKPEVVVEETPYEKLLNEHPWLEEARYEYMYSAPVKKKNAKDYESWIDEWSKIIYDYARLSVLHILYLRKLNAEKPFSKLENRDGAIAAIAQKLVEQNVGVWLNKKTKEAIRVYWKTLDEWADEIFEWAKNSNKYDPILTFEIRESGEMFAELPKRDLTRIFKQLEKEEKGEIIKTDKGEITFKISLDY